MLHLISLHPENGAKIKRILKLDRNGFIKMRVYCPGSGFFQILIILPSEGFKIL